MKTDKYCSSMVHLLRGRELGAQNALTGNAKRCTKHKMLQMCDNMNDCNGLFDDRAYSYLATCHCMIRGFHDENYDEEEIYDRIDTNDENIIYIVHIYSTLLKNMRISILK